MCPQSPRNDTSGASADSSEAGLHNQPAAADRHRIFEQAALQRLRSGSNNSNPVGFLPLPVRLTAIATCSIAGFGVLWACLARVPVQVNGIAAIAPEAQVSSATARTDGVLHFKVSGVGQDRLTPIQREHLKDLSSFWVRSVVNNTSTLSFSEIDHLALDSMAPPVGQELVMPESQEIINDRSGIRDMPFVHIKGNTIVARVDNAAEMDELDAIRRVTAAKIDLNQGSMKGKNESVSQYNELDSVIAAQHQRHRQELEDRMAMYTKMHALWQQGVITKSQLIEERSKLNAARSQLVQIDRDRLSTQLSASDLKQQRNQAGLTTLESRNQLQEALVRYMSKVFTIAPPSGMYIVNRTARNGMQVTAGDELFTYSVQKPALPEVVPVFVDAATVQQLSRGMAVLVTPKGISRAQYGGIPGTVLEVGKLPLPDEGIAAFAGGRTLAQTVQQGRSGMYLVKVKLQQSEPEHCQQMLSNHCYRWSTSRRPPFPVRVGTLADVQINVQYRRPIEFVMPALRQALGLVVENR